MKCSLQSINSDKEVQDAIFSKADELIEAAIAGTPSELHNNPYFQNNNAKKKPEELHNNEFFKASDGTPFTARRNYCCYSRSRRN